MTDEKKAPRVVFSASDDNEIEFDVISVDSLEEAAQAMAREDEEERPKLIVLGTALSQCKGSGITHHA